MPYYKRNLLILSATIFLASVSWNQVIPFLPLFMRDLGTTSEKAVLNWMGVIFALQSLSSVFAMPFWGKMGDKYGRKPMAIRAGICLAGIYFAMSVCRTPVQLAILRFLNGALTGFIPMSMALIATNTPENRAPRYIATAQAASASGLIVGPAVGGLLASAMGSYRASMEVSGVVVILSTFLVWWLVKEPNKLEGMETTSLLEDLRISLQSKVLSAIMLAVMVSGIYYASLSPVLTLHLTRIRGNAPEWLIGAVYALPSVAMVLTAHLWASIGKRRGYFLSIQIGLVGAAIAAIVLTFMSDIWTFAALYLVGGLFSSAIGPSTGALIATRVPEDFRGRAYGMQQSATTLGSLVAPLLATRIGTSLGISAIFWFIGIIALLGCCGLAVLSNNISEKHE
ncbi:MAG: MFS transporter [Armatimonadota bacterium]